MRVERLTNGQSVYAEILAYDNKHNLYAYEATKNDVLDLAGDDRTLIGAKQGRAYYVITLENNAVSKVERVCKDVAINFALA